MKRLCIVLALSVFLTGITPYMATAQDSDEEIQSAPKEQLSLNDMAKATVVATTEMDQRSPVTLTDEEYAEGHRFASRLYKLENCTDDSACYFEVYMFADDPISDARPKTAGRTSPAPMPVGWITTQVCGVSIYGALGLQVAQLQQNITIKYSNASGGLPRLPAKGLTGNLNGTWATIPNIWIQLNGPNAFPGWNIKVTSGGLYFTADGILQFGPFPWTQYFPTTMVVDTNTTYCV
ncbi:MAG: hypothetical protein DWB44_05510 [Chloroflexi bacterium]|nr:hypothetical protein [Chloroflexota bacterium]OQY84964.1 MAG: hypothetical protein B6D42_04305 [Anaerolineae bacterium UTCFX5]RIK23061.1 MAG: hypothetical protein DCC53_01680 [Chloroflexota bacterium]GIK28747.1 MAG: hypothetical protein BroJett007_18850 [Chloroflexota bacterium]